MMEEFDLLFLEAEARPQLKEVLEEAGISQPRTIQFYGKSPSEFARRISEAWTEMKSSLPGDLPPLLGEVPSPIPKEDLLALEKMWRIPSTSVTVMTCPSSVTRPP